MKRLFLLTTMLITLFTTQAKVWIIRADGTGNFSTLQTAHDSPQVLSGDTLQLYPSNISYGSLVATKRLSLFGVGYTLTRNTVTDYTNAAVVDSLLFKTGTGGSLVSGLVVKGGIQILATKIVVERCYIKGKGVKIDANDVAVKQNFIELQYQETNFGNPFACVSISPFHSNVWVHHNYMFNGDVASSAYLADFYAIFNGSVGATVVNNTILGDVYMSAGYFVNNILRDGTVQDTTAATFLNNLCNTAQLPYGNNLHNVDMQTVFNNFGQTYDSLWILSKSSPAQGYANDGGACGMYDEADTITYIPNGYPKLPTITNFTAKTPGEIGGTFTAKFKAYYKETPFADVRPALNNVFYTFDNSTSGFYVKNLGDSLGYYWFTGTFPAQLTPGTHILRIRTRDVNMRWSFDATVEICVSTYQLISYAGRNQTYFSENYADTVRAQMNATPPIGMGNAIGYWLKNQSDSSVIADTLNPKTYIYGIKYGKHNFVWQVSDGVCSINDTMIVTKGIETRLVVSQDVLKWSAALENGYGATSADLVVFEAATDKTVTLNLDVPEAFCGALKVLSGNLIIEGIIQRGDTVAPTIVMDSLSIGGGAEGATLTLGSTFLTIPGGDIEEDRGGRIIKVGAGGSLNIEPDPNRSTMSYRGRGGVKIGAGGSLNIEPDPNKTGRPGRATVKVGAGGSLNIEPDPNKSGRPGRATVKVGAGGSLNIEPDPNRVTKVNTGGGVLVKGGSLNIEPDPNKNYSGTYRSAEVVFYGLEIDEDTLYTGRPVGSVRVGAGGSLNIEPDPNKSLNRQGGDVLVRNGSLEIVADTTLVGRPAGSVIVRGSLNIEPDPNKAGRPGRATVKVGAGGSLNIEPDPNRTDRPVVVKVGAGGSLNIEPDPNRPTNTSVKGAVLVKGGSLNIEPDPNRSSTNIYTERSAQVVVFGGIEITDDTLLAARPQGSVRVGAGGSLNIEPDPNRIDSTNFLMWVHGGDFEIVADTTLRGRPSGKVIVHGSLNIEPDPNKDARPGRATVKVGAGGSLNIEPDPNRADRPIVVKVGAGGSLNIEPDPNRPTSTTVRGGLVVKGGSLNIEPDPNRDVAYNERSADVIFYGSVIVDEDTISSVRPQGTIKVGAGGSLNIEPDPNKDSRPIVVRVGVGGSLNIEPDPNRVDSRPTGSVVIRGSLNIEPDPNKNTRPGRATVKVGAGGALNIEPDPNRSDRPIVVKVGAGGSLNIEPDPNRADRPAGSVVIRGSLNIEPDPNKTGRPGRATVKVGAGGSLNIEPDPNKSVRPSAVTVRVGAGGSLNIEPDSNKGSRPATQVVIRGSLNIEPDPNKAGIIEKFTVGKGANVTIYADTLSPLSGNLYLGNNTYTTIDNGASIHFETADTASKAGRLIMDNSASLLDRNDSTGIYGNALIRKVLQANRFNLMTIPMERTAIIANSNILAQQFSQNTGWTTTVAANEFQGGIGLLLRSLQTDTLLFSGRLNKNNYLFKQLSFIPDTLQRAGWHLIGNPYPTALDLIKLSTDTSGISGSMYLWNGQNFGAFVDGVQINNVSTYLLPMQALVVRTVENTTGALRMLNNAKFHFAPDSATGETFGYKPNLLRLRVTTDNFSDETVIRFADSSSFDGNRKYDAWKMPNPIAEAPQIFVFGNKQYIRFGIKTYPLQATSSWRVPMGFKGGQEGSFMLSVAENNFPMNTKILLFDKITGKTYNVLGGAQWLFQHKPDDIVNRFDIYINQVVGIEDNTSNNQPYLYNNGNTLYVSFNHATKSDIKVFNSMGQEVFKTQIFDKQNNIYLPLQQGCYFVKISTLQSVTTSKIIIR